MKFNVKKLKEIFKGDFRNLSDDDDFSFLNIAKPDGELKHNIDSSRELLFTIRETDYQKEGWYTNNFDRLSPEYDYDQIFAKGTSVITDNKELFDKYKDKQKIIFVESLPKTISKIYSHVLKQVKPKVIALTGSVGKTTAMCLIEDVVKTEQPILRLYSKRITPLNLTSMIINFTHENLKFITLEMSMNRKSHIEKLTKLLPPDYSGILGINGAHLGTQDIHTIQDIWESKSNIFSDKSNNFVNLDDEVSRNNYNQLGLDVITLGTNKEFYPDYRGEMIDKKFVIFKRDRKTNHETEFLRSSLYFESTMSMHQALFATAIADDIGISPENIAKAIESFSPKENRLQKYKDKERDVIFDGDASTAPRFLVMSDNVHQNQTLIISNYWSNEDKTAESNRNEIEQFKKDIFPKFDKVFIAENCANTNIIDPKNYPELSEKIQIFAPEYFEKVINSSKGTIILHHGIYTRKDKADHQKGAYKQCNQYIERLQNNQGLSLILQALLDNQK